MRINSLNQPKYLDNNYHRSAQTSVSTAVSPKPSAQIITGHNFSYYKQNNLIKVISFAGKPSYNPEYEQIPNLKMKVAAVSQFQDAISEIKEQDVRKHPQINFDFDKEKREIKLVYDKTGKQVGFIHYEILDHLYEQMEKSPADFKIEIANVIRFPEMKNQGINARIKYIGKDTEATRALFEATTEDPECIPITFPYKKPDSPKDLLNLILKNEEQLHGTQSKKDMETVVQSITDVINDAKNKSFLLLGHKDPDGDDIGCLLGMKNAIELKGQGKIVDCSVDDKIPVLFKYLKDINQIKVPNKESVVKSFEKGVQDKANEGLFLEAGILEGVKKHFAKTTKNLPKDKIYDVVILMDVSSPERVGFNYSKYIGPDTNVIIIDHHIKNAESWNSKKALTNIDVEKMQKKNLMWVVDRAPAATEMVAAIAGKINPKLNDEGSKYSIKEKNIIKKMAAAVLTGIHTDTSSYSRSANLFAEDLLLPKHLRPTYNPIGLAKWFSQVTERKITRNYIEASLDNQDYKTKPIKKLAGEILSENTFRNDELQLNHARIDKSQIDKLWLEAAKTTPDITLKDILGAVKYSSAFKSLKRTNPNSKADTIVYLMSQTSQKGKININGGIANNDVISFSFRSQKGTNHAAILASMFGGGGHGAAAGGRISGEGLDFNSKFEVLIDGQRESNPSKLLEILTENFELDHQPNASQGIPKKQVNVVKTLDDSQGKTINELITDVVKEIRKLQIPEKITKQALSVIA